MFINIALILFCLTIEPSEDAPPDTERSHNTGLVVYVFIFTADLTTLAHHMPDIGGLCLSVVRLAPVSLTLRSS